MGNAQNLSLPAPISSAQVGTSAQQSTFAITSDDQRVFVDVTGFAAASIYIDSAPGSGFVNIAPSIQGGGLSNLGTYILRTMVDTSLGATVPSVITTTTNSPNILEVSTLGCTSLQFHAAGGFSGTINVTVNPTSNLPIVMVGGPVQQYAGAPLALNDAIQNTPFTDAVAGRSAFISKVVYPLVYNGTGTLGWERPRTPHVYVTVNSVACGPSGGAIWSPAAGFFAKSFRVMGWKLYSNVPGNVTLNDGSAGGTTLFTIPFVGTVDNADLGAGILSSTPGNALYAVGPNTCVLTGTIWGQEE